MSPVIDMNAWKAAQTPKPRAPQRLATEPSPYCCVRCGSDLFRILEDGHVRCGGCMVEIYNLKAT
jgi:hypothetical protein